MSTPGTCQCGCGAPVEEGAAFTDAHDPTPVTEAPPAYFDLDSVFDLLDGLEDDMRSAMVYAVRWCAQHPKCPGPTVTADCHPEHLCAPCQSAMWRDFTRSRKGE